METKKDRLFPKRSPCAGEGTRTHTHEAPDPKSGLSTNFNTPATEYKDIKKCKKTKGPEPTVPDP